MTTLKEKDCPGVLLCAAETASVTASLPLLGTREGVRRGAEKGRAAGGLPAAAFFGLLGAFAGLMVGMLLVPLALVSGLAKVAGHLAARWRNS